ncbi:decaprenyl-phosphate phosphoribosyltransferase [soil metagenome]
MPWHRAVLRSMRPRQWAKNGLVVAAPLSAAAFDSVSVYGTVVATFFAFTLAASAVYLLNDVRDRDSDRLHPVKRLRPVAAGLLSTRSALTVGAALAVASLALAWVIEPDLGVTVSFYIALQVAYAVWLKHQAVLDIAVVASGFLLRAIAGGVAVGVPLSQWFLLVAGFGSLFVVAGKRFSELHTVGVEQGTRRSLSAYSESYLRFVWSIAAAVTITAYSLWAFEISGDEGINWQALSIAPFTLGLLRYAVDIDRGVAGEPEEVIIGDHTLQALALVWLGLFVLGVQS